MDLLGGRNGACKSRRRMELLFIAVAVSQFCMALSQPVIFHYGKKNAYASYAVPKIPSAEVIELQADNITCLRDFYISNTTSLSLSLPVTLQRTEGEVDVVGRCLYNTPVQLQQATGVTSFSTMFEVWIVWDFYDQGYCVPGSVNFNGTLQGLAFIIASETAMEGAGNGYLGWLNSTTNAQQGHNSTGHNFAVEIDLIQNSQFEDPVGIHVGIDSNSLISVSTSTQPSWESESLVSGYLDLTVWIDYDGHARIMNIYATNDSIKPATPMLSSAIDLTELLSQEGMFVGFSGSLSNVTFNGSTDVVQSFINQGGQFGYAIVQWSFNSNGQAPDLPRDADGWFEPFMSQGPNLKKRMEKIVIISVTVPFAVLASILTVVVFRLHRRNARLLAMAKKYQIEDDLLEQGPQNFKYKALSVATKGFSSRELLGSGGFGSVYRGRLKGKGKGAEKHTDVAVKRISATSQQGAREFLAEVKVIGQAQHRNLVRLLGWCHERGELLLVYDFMPNGSVDQHIFKDSEGEPVLTWARRLKIVSGVATALAYLHEEWEQRVIHRDVKSSNVMLDRDFNARLGDFGLARLSAHDQAPQSTVLAGTFGYLAPELTLTLKATEKTDVYAFGAVVLEMATGRRPLLNLEDDTTANERLLVDWVWGLYRDDALLEAADSRLQSTYDPGEMVLFLKIGLLCSHPDPQERPTMREVLNIWKGSSLFPALPRTKPTPVFISTSHILSDCDTTMRDNLDTSWGGMPALASDVVGQSAPIIPLKVFADSSQPEIPVERGNSPSHAGLRYRRYNSKTSLPISLPI